MGMVYIYPVIVDFGLDVQHVALACLFGRMTAVGCASDLLQTSLGDP